MKIEYKDYIRVCMWSLVNYNVLRTSSIPGKPTSDIAFCNIMYQYDPHITTYTVKVPSCDFIHSQNELWRSACTRNSSLEVDVGYGVYMELWDFAMMYDKYRFISYSHQPFLAATFDDLSTHFLCIIKRLCCLGLGKIVQI